MIVINWLLIIINLIRINKHSASNPGQGKDRSIVLAAVKSNGNAIQWADASFRSDREALDCVHGFTFFVNVIVSKNVQLWSLCASRVCLQCDNDITWWLYVDYV